MKLYIDWHFAPMRIWRFFDGHDDTATDLGPSGPLLKSAMEEMLPFVLLNQGNQAALEIEWRRQQHQIAGSDFAWLTLLHVKAQGKTPNYLEGCGEAATGCFQFRVALQSHRHDDGEENCAIDLGKLGTLICRALIYHVPGSRPLKSATLLRALPSGRLQWPIAWDNFGQCFRQVEKEPALSAIVQKGMAAEPLDWPDDSGSWLARRPKG